MQNYMTTAAIFGLVLPTLCLGQLPKPKTEPGVLVRLYDIGQPLGQIPELAVGQLPNAAKVRPTIDLDSERGDFGELKEAFLTEITGVLNIEKAGSYAFRLLSDDGAKLWIDRHLIIDHDGLHGPEAKDGRVELAAEPHRLKILHFQAGGGAQLTLQWHPAGVVHDGFELVPAGALSHKAEPAGATAPGKKKIIPPLRRGRPGDGSRVSGTHPGFESVRDLEVRDFPVRGIETYWLGSGHLRVIGSPPSELETHPLMAWLPPYDDYTFVDPLPDPYADQFRVMGRAGQESKRLLLHAVGSVAQGCVFRFGAATPAIAILRASGKLVFEMLGVRAMTNGFEIEFTKPLDGRCGWEAESYYIEQWPFDIEKSKAPTRDGVVYPVKSASVSPDRKKVFLEIENLKPSHVVYIRLLPPCVSEGGELPWSTEAWYTLNVIPKDRVGQVLPPPSKEPQNFLTEQEKAAGWKLLFDGQTTKGWHGWKKDSFPDGWKVIDGCIVRVGPGGDIATDEQFDNFELSLEWRICAAGNSGIFFRVSEDEKYKWPWETGLEMQVLDNAEHPDGRSPLTSAGSNYALHAPVRDVTQPVGLFNQARIVANGSRVEHWLNGVKIVEYTLGGREWRDLVAASKFTSMPSYGRANIGRIVLQDHGDKVCYRNIKIRPLVEE